MKDEQISIDSHRNKIFVPGSGELPMVGLDRAKLDAAEARAIKENVALRRMIMSTWQCVQCKQKFAGSVVKAKKKDIDVLFVCPECGGAVIVIEDALNLRKPPRGL